jgi:hypothetical protein
MQSRGTRRWAVPGTDKKEKAHPAIRSILWPGGAGSSEAIRQILEKDFLISDVMEVTNGKV